MPLHGKFAGNGSDKATGSRADLSDNCLTGGRRVKAVAQGESAERSQRLMEGGAVSGGLSHAGAGTPASVEGGAVSGGRSRKRASAPAPMTLEEARVWARVGVIATLALVLSYVETFIPLPVPVPGIKLGLANIAVLVALELLDVKSAALVAVIKVLAAGFLFGNPLMMAYSAGGTFLAFASMAALSRISGLSVVLVAVVGAVLHNVGQLAVASALLGTPLVWATAPLLVIAACVTGALSGVATRYTLTCLEAGA